MIFKYNTLTVLRHVLGEKGSLKEVMFSGILVNI